MVLNCLAIRKFPPLKLTVYKAQKHFINDYFIHKHNNTNRSICKEIFADVKNKAKKSENGKKTDGKNFAVRVIILLCYFQFSCFLQKSFPFVRRPFRDCKYMF